MNHTVRRYIVFLFSLLFFLTGVEAQTTLNSEDDLKKQAEKSFEAGAYAESATLYSQLLSLYPKDGTYNYRGGISFFYSEKDRSKAVVCLKKAVLAPEDSRPMDVYYYLGRAQLLNNQAEEAIVNFETFQKNGSPKEVGLTDVARQIEMCKNAMRLMASPQVIDVLEKETVSRDAYYSGYKLEPYKVKVMTTPEEFRSSQDKRKNTNRQLYLEKDQAIVMFSSLGENGKNGSDIFIIRNFSPGSTSTGENIGSVINTPYDEDFPYMSADGKTLYFSSKGHSSMGGYDVFKSTWNAERSSWSKPENLGVPINSSSDDFFYLYDDQKAEGYFSSDRETSPDQVNVYRFSFRDKPILYSKLNAKFNVPNAEKENSVRLSVFNAEQSRMVGILKPNRRDTTYSLALRSGSVYILKIEYPGFKPVYDTLDLLDLKGFDQNEKLIPVSFNPKDTLPLALNLRSEQPSPSDLDIMKTKIKEWKENNAGSLSGPESIELETESTVLAAKPEDSKSTDVKANLSNKEIVENAYSDAEKTRAESKKYYGEADLLKAAATRKQSAAKAKESEANDLTTKADSSADEAEKADLALRARNLRNDADVLNKEAELILFEAKQRTEIAKSKETEANFAQNRAQQLDVSSGENLKTSGDNKAVSGGGKTRQEYNEEIRRSVANQHNLKVEAANLQKQAEQRKEEAATMTDPTEREKALTSAYNLEARANQRLQSAEEAEEKQAQLAEAAKALGETPTEVSGEKASDSKSEQLRTESMALTAEAKSMEREAKLLSQKAKETEDPTEKKRLTQETLSQMNKAAAKRIEADKKLNEANSSQKQEIAKANEVIVPENIKQVSSNPKFSSEDKTKIVTIIEQGNAMVTQSEAKKTEANQLSESSKTMVDPAEKKSTARRAIQLLNEASSLQANADDKFKEAKKLEEKAQDASAPVLAGNKSEQKAEAKSKEESDELNQTFGYESNFAVDQTRRSILDPTIKYEDPVLKMTTGSKPLTNQTAASYSNKEEAYKANTSEEINAIAEFEKVNTSAEALKKKSISMVSEAKLSTDPNEKRVLIAKAMAVMKEAEAKQSQADLVLSEAGINPAQVAAGTIIAANPSENLSSIISEPGTGTVPITASGVVKTESTSSQTKTNEFENLSSTSKTETIQEKKVEESTQESPEKIITESTPVESTSTSTPPPSFTSTSTVTQSPASKEADANKSANQLVYEGKSLQSEAEILKKQSEEVDVSAKRMSNPADKSKFISQSMDLQNESKAKQELADSKFAQAEAKQPGITSKIASLTDDKKELAVVSTPASTNTVAPQSPSSTSQTITPFVTEPIEQTQVDSQEKIEEEAIVSSPVKPSSSTSFEETTPTEIKQNENTDKSANLSSNPNYPRYSNLVSEAKEQKQATEIIFAEATALENESNELSQQAQEQKELSTSAKKRKDKKAASKKYFELDNLAASKKFKADSIFQVAELSSSEANAKERDAEVLLASMRQATPEVTPEEPASPVVSQANPVTPVQTESPEKTTPAVVTTSETSPAEAKVIVINASSKKSTYSSSNPIPINPVISDGLLFRVQIGAFRNPIDPSIFVGMQPIMGETTSSGLTRYLAGEFRGFEPANWAKNEIRLIGYKDAFVVPYFNGKRISISEAKAILASMGGNERARYASTSTSEMNVLKKNNIYPEKYSNANELAIVKNFNEANVNSPIPASAPTSSSTSTNNAGTAQTGTYYTIQVGVFRSSDVPDRLKSVKPLTKSRTANGLNRYTSGNYPNRENAAADLPSVRSLVPDAFVTLLKNEDIIEQNKDTKITNSNPTPIRNENTNSTASPANPSPSNTSSASTASKPSPVSPKQTEVEDNTLVYKVQVGAFRDKVPFEMLTKFLSVRSAGISNVQNADGMNVFYAGRTQDFSEIEKVRQKMIDAGITEAFIVAMKGNTMVPLEEAKTILGK